MTRRRGRGTPGPARPPGSSRGRKLGFWGRLLRLLLVVVLGLAGLLAWREVAGLASLEHTRDELRQRLTRARSADPRLLQAPNADVLIGMPVGFTTALGQKLTQGLLDQVQVSLRGIRIQKEGVVKTRVLLGTIQPGHYALDLTLHEASALLKPGAPRVDFQGKRLGVAVTVAVTQGQGRATAKLDWDSQGLGKIVCEDFNLTQPVTARVVPRTYDVKGAFVLSVEGGVLVAKPDFPDIVLRVGIEPSEETWKAIGEAIEKRSWMCQAVLKKVDVPKLLKDWLAQGFEVTIPRNVFKPFRLPAAVQQSVTFEGRAYALRMRLLDLRLTPDILWYGADVEVRRAEPPSPPSPPATPPASPSATPPASPPATATPAPEAPPVTDPPETEA